MIVLRFVVVAVGACVGCSSNSSADPDANPPDDLTQIDAGSPDASQADGERLRTTTRTQNFDEPAWTGVNNQPQKPPCEQVDQDFGYSAESSYAGGSPGEIGGKIWRSTRRAYFAQPIETRTFDDSLSASGTFSVTSSLGPSGVLFGWFNSEPSAGWRNNNSLAFRLDGEDGFYRLYFEYGTQYWCTGTFDIDRDTDPTFSANGTVHSWSLSYDPDANNKTGVIELVLDGASYTLNLDPLHRQEGAVFDRFGMWNRQTEAKSPMTVYFDDLELDGAAQDFADDPGWVGEDNRTSYEDCEIEPRHNFGHRNTNLAGGDAAGEAGGIIWRIEVWAFHTAGYYADTEIGTLTLDDRLAANGKLAMTRTAVDAGLFVGWFNTGSYNHLSDGKAPPNFLGAIVEGRSRIGQKLNATYRTRTGGCEFQTDSPKILPTGESVDWSIEYDPSAAENNLVVSVDTRQSVFTVPPAAIQEGATFDAFGIGTLRDGGHWVEMFFDDISYTVVAENE